jgi:hypothetical protein
MKRCSRCRKFKELTEFGKNRGLKDGLNCYCKQCANEIHPYHPTRNREPKLPKMDKALSDKCMCRILTYHHTIMEDDDERLPTAFIIDVVKGNI